MDSKQKRPKLHQTLFPIKNRLALSTGDLKGVGFYITQQALTRLGVQKNFQFVVWSDSRSQNLRVPSFKTLVFKNSRDALKHAFRPDHLIQIKSSSSVGARLLDAGKQALEKKVSALITGPVSKNSLTAYKSVGQTDLLKKLTHSSDVFMCFRGSFFNVLLLNDHVPFRQTSLNISQLKKLVELALLTRSSLPKKWQHKKLGLLGLNPHAGEHGLLGKEEEKILKPFLQTQPELEGPLSPDVAFLKQNWDKYSFFIALYHDQGLIPFKLVHGTKSFSQSLGLAFLRFGVSHGTAPQLKQKDISSDSFLLCLKEALRTLRQNLKKRA